MSFCSYFTFIQKELINEHTLADEIADEVVTIDYLSNARMKILLDLPLVLPEKTEIYSLELSGKPEGTVMAVFEAKNEIRILHPENKEQEIHAMMTIRNCLIWR